ncbi:Phage terminase-like protein, large subunit, contains N-terminal HTH domain [Halobacillus karajensis]|uniref:terminase TerL endonuclease subunit n=1 Tax=Halobacillus karajensis TaxID=195088 RepID=UPI0008A81172|nr:terminase TerL endonuclease subunit [Halobacillus karajensis]SEH78302.1 Phage terminase-like protein, large subunit, contains N-terminal HTH domain [Halobacillus karajensis]
MISNKHVENYINLYDTGKIKLNKERILLLEYLKEYVLSRDDVYFDEELINNFIKFTEKWYFPLEPFQKFIAAFVFLFYKETGRNFFRKFLIMMGRGGGKNGLISALSHYLTSELHGIPKYNVSIVANSEDQAKTSFEEVYDAIESKEPLEKAFYRTKVQIKNNATKSIMKFRTSNASTKDGLRDGCVIYDEIHQYQTNEVVRVFSSGLGKVRNPREFFIGTDGYVREGYLDTMKERAMNILEGKDLDDSMFPFICKLDNPEEVKDKTFWEKANPMFSEPRSEYAEELFYIVQEEYKELANDPSNREEFMTKRMNLPEVDLTKTVAPWEDILATNRPFPELEHRTCIGGLDFASIKDFAAVGLLFKVDDDYVWKTHSFVRKGFLDKVNLQAPIKKWEEANLLTIVDEPVIDISNIVNWFVEMREIYGLTKIIADTFRLDLVKTALEAEGFELEYIRNPKAIHSLLAPKVETMFAKRNIIYDDNPLMRWYTNNVYVKIKKDGNKEYLKKDEFRRKTDGFQAFIHALWKADDELEEEADFMIADISF